jgi:hypothetical protein
MSVGADELTARFLRESSGAVASRGNAKDGIAIACSIVCDCSFVEHLASVGTASDHEVICRGTHWWRHDVEVVTTVVSCVTETGTTSVASVVSKVTGMIIVEVMVSGTSLVDVAVTVTVGVTCTVEVVTLVTVDCERIVVVPMTPTHEQADEYLIVPEHAEAYLGTKVGVLVVVVQVLSRFATGAVTVTELIMVSIDPIRIVEEVVRVSSIVVMVTVRESMTVVNWVLVGV